MLIFCYSVVIAWSFWGCRKTDDGLVEITSQQNVKRQSPRKSKDGFDTTQSLTNLSDQFRAEVKACERLIGQRQSCDLTGPVKLEGIGLVALNRLGRSNDNVSLDHWIMTRVFEKRHRTAFNVD